MYVVVVVVVGYGLGVWGGVLGVFGRMGVLRVRFSGKITRVCLGSDSRMWYGWDV